MIVVMLRASLLGPVGERSEGQRAVPPGRSGALETPQSTRRVPLLTITALSTKVLHADAGPARRAATSASQDIQCRVLLRPSAGHFFFLSTSRHAFVRSTNAWFEV